MKYTWKPLKNPQIILPQFRRAYIQALPPWGGGNRIPVQDTGFIAFLVQVRKLAAHCSKVGKVAVLFIVFSAVTGKLHKYKFVTSTEEEHWKAALFSLQAQSFWSRWQEQNTEEMQHQVTKQQAPSSKQVHLSGTALSAGEKK